MLGLDPMSNDVALVFWLASFVLGVAVAVWGALSKIVDSVLIGAGIAIVSVPLLWNAIAYN